MNKPRILIVDDDEGFSRLVQLVLEKAKLYEVKIENRSLNALAAARKFKPELILLDVDMPGFDGGEVARQVREDAALWDTKIVFFTSLLSQQETRKGLVSRGGELFFSKPLDPSVLIRCIETALSHIPAEVPIAVECRPQHDPVVARTRIHRNNQHLRRD